MKNKFILIIIVLALLSFFVVKNMSKRPAGLPVAPKPTPAMLTDLPKNADKIEILHFHPSKQCVSCINLGKFTKEILEKTNSPKIVFKNIDKELPENFKIVAEYKVSESALYFVVTKDGKETREEDTAVWRYVLNETEFKNYFENKLNYLLSL